jgi:arylsulfatase A-like enzyme
MVHEHSHHRRGRARHRRDPAARARPLRTPSDNEAVVADTPSDVARLLERHDRYEYLEHSTGEVEPYDLRADPGELGSLTADPSRDATLAALAAELDRIAACAGARCR